MMLSSMYFARIFNEINTFRNTIMVNNFLLTSTVFLTPNLPKYTYHDLKKPNGERICNKIGDYMLAYYVLSKNIYPISKEQTILENISFGCFPNCDGKLLLSNHGEYALIAPKESYVIVCACKERNVTKIL